MRGCSESASRTASSSRVGPGLGHRERREQHRRESRGGERVECERMPKWSEIQPAAEVLTVLPMPMAKPTAPSARLKRPERAATSLTISGTRMPNPAPAMPSSTCTAITSVGLAVVEKMSARSGSIVKPTMSTRRRP